MFAVPSSDGFAISLDQERDGFAVVLLPWYDVNRKEVNHEH
jgi:hypothetical protein